MDGSKLLVKGVKAVWRQSAPLVARVLEGSLERIIMQDDVPAAVRFVEAEVSPLGTGGASCSGPWAEQGLPAAVGPAWHEAC